MNRTPARRSSLFLTEFMISLLFFLLVCTVCIPFFAKAHTISKEAKELNTAVQMITSCAEQFRAGVDLPETSSVYYDQSWKPCENSSADYCLNIQIHTDGQEQTAAFEMIRNTSKEVIYSLSFEKYITGEEMNR